MPINFKYSFPLLLLFGLILCFSSGCDEVDPPELLSLEPEMGPRETLVVMKGNNLAEIRELLFNGEPIAFNTAYNSDVALLFRIPKDISLGEKLVTVRTDGGSFETTFTVSEDPPVVPRFFPRSANEGDLVTLIGENFFEPPLEVTFKTGEFIDDMWTDSLQAEIVFAAEDSLIVRVPEGAKTGFIRVVANGGTAQTGRTFQIFEPIAITDFDGEDDLIANDEWNLFGNNDQRSGAPFIRSTLPAPVDGNFMQLSGTAASATAFLGGARSPGGSAIDSFGITTIDPGNVFLELDVNSNGRTQTTLVLTLAQQNGSIFDFTTRIVLDDAGWNRVSIPLVRFTSSAGNVVKPQKVNQIKFLIEDPDNTGQRVEANIDNVAFVERL